MIQIAKMASGNNTTKTGFFRAASHERDDRINIQIHGEKTFLGT